MFSTEEVEVVIQPVLMKTKTVDVSTASNIETR